MKLEHIAPYLPYGLKFYAGTIGGVELIYEAICYRESVIMTYLNGENDDDGYIWMGLEQYNLKPVMRPLSEFCLPNDIEKVAEFVGLGKWCDAYDYFFEVMFDDIANIGKLVLQAPQPIFNYFLANHYNVFGVDAIDINTLEK